MASKSEVLVHTQELRAGSILTEKEINLLKCRWSPHRAQKLSIDAEQECQEFMEHGPFAISVEQAQKGRQYWQSLCYTSNGVRRNTEFVRNNCNETVWHVLENFDRFELVNWEWQHNGYGMSWPYPVYRMYATDSMYFDYVARAWISGGSIVV